jgi:hypothetical protein
MIKAMFQMSSKLTQFITLDEKDINSDNWCGICGATQICMPFQVVKDCNHIYCYYCIKNKMQECEEEEEPYKCAKCGLPVEEIEPYNLVKSNNIS